MPKKMLIDATHPEETRVVVVDGNKVEEFDFESQSKRQLAGNIYLAKVTRVEPSLQAAFVDYGGNRHGFLAFSEIHPDYYQIPVADREALLAEERAYAKAQAEEDDEAPKKRTRRRRSKAKAEEVAADDAVATKDVAEDSPAGEAEAPAADEAATAEAKAENTAEKPATDDPAGLETIDFREEDEGEPIVDDSEERPLEATDKDEAIESVAEEDDSDDVRPRRKQRSKRYKIQEVVKVRQILLIQVVKEERGNKGAALTTYLSLAGRYCVLMPNTARGGGISRKITNAPDRKKLKAIANEIEVPEGAGLIIRTAGAKRTKSEIKRDYEYLQRLWEQIRELTLQSIAPSKIYEEGNLIKRSIRDLYNREIDEVLVEGDTGYRTAKDFMKMIMPSHAKNVKPYEEPLPLFARYQVESTLGAMFNPTVQLPSGGYIVIGVTEALVAIDVNSGRATKEGSIEQTALKTNLEAAEEVARQLRLRDLAGLIVIDFIDMDERKNNNAVEKRFKDKLKTDRARIQVGRISGFGLLEMSRQRLRPGMIEATTQPCSHCHGTGLLRSDDNAALGILRQIEEEGVRGKSKEVLIKAPVSIANYLMNQKREHIAGIEARYGLSVRIEADTSLVSPDFTLEKFRTATRFVPEVDEAAISGSAALMAEIEAEAAEAPAEEETAAEDKPKKRRRRRRRRGRGNAEEGQTQEAQENQDDQEASTEEAPAEAAEPAEAAPEGEAEKPKRRRRSRKKAEDKAEDATPEAEASDAAAPEEVAPAEGEEAPAKPKRKRSSRSRTKAKAEPAPETDATAEAPATEPDPAPEPEPQAAPEEVAEEKPKRKRRTRVSKPSEPEPEPVGAEAPVEAPAEAVAEADGPKRRGWWSLGRG